MTMAKAINWPVAFREEVLAEDTHKIHVALRLGDLYYANRYWVDGEVVDIRINHLKARKATVVGDLKQVRIADLSSEDFVALKSTLKSVDAVVTFLATTYDQPVTSETLVTLVYYRNHEIDPENCDVQDDPHL